MLSLNLNSQPPNLLLGTSSWSWPDWRGILYSEGCKGKDFIREYARKLPTVEIDSSFYRSPSAAITTPGAIEVGGDVHEDVAGKGWTGVSYPEKNPPSNRGKNLIQRRALCPRQ